MKSQKVFLVLIVLLAYFQICIGQEESKAVLIDTFSRGSNDDLLARIYNFFPFIDKNSKGYIIIHGTKISPLSKYLYERKIKGCFQWVKYPVKNFDFVLAEDKDEFRVEFWKVPNGSDKPQFVEIIRDYKLSEMTEPYLIYQYSWFDEYCPLYFNLEFYSKFLKANTSNLIGKIVIREKTLTQYRRVRQKYLKELTESNGISQKQLRFVRAKYEHESDSEFWLVPVKTQQ